MTKHVLGALALGVFATGTALAQPSEPAPAGESTLSTTTTETVTPMPPQGPVVQQTTTTSVTVSNDPGGLRPTELVFGFGAGYAFGGGSTDLQNPNVTSVRLRLPSGLTFEPSVTLAHSSTNQDPPDSTDGVTTLRIGTGVRLPVVSRGKFDLEGLGIVSLGTVMNNPDGDDNNSSTTTVQLNWGLAVSYWISTHWNLSVSAYNPLVSFSKTSTDTPDASQTQTSFGVVWDPTLVAMIHLYN